jgi:hypothetical protein
MARPANPGFTPAQRGPRLGDERPTAKERDPVLTTIGWKTSDIRLTAAGTDMSAGNAAAYNFGVCDKDSVGAYLFSAQSAASATADPLGAQEWIYLDVREESAGVFKVDPQVHFDGLVASEDDTQDATNIAVAARQSDKDTPVFTTTNGDSQVSFSVTTATTAGTLNGLITPQGGDAETNSLVIVECRSTTTEVWTVQRLS